MMDPPGSGNNGGGSGGSGGTGQPGAGGPGALIIHTLAQPKFQLLVKLPLVQSCPFMDRLNGNIDLLYLYADGTPVTKARFTIEAVPGSPLASGPLGDDGRRRLSMPKHVAYQFYFDQDVAPDGSVFQFFPAYKTAPPDLNAAIGDWHPTLATQGKAARWQLRWGDVALAQAAHDPARPVLEKFVRHVVDQAVAMPEKGALQREAAQILLALLLGAQDQALWRRLVVNRIAAGAGCRSRLLQELHVYLEQAPQQCALPLTAMLNSAGKGNAAGFYRVLAGELPEFENALTRHINGLLQALRTQLGEIAAADTAGHWNQAVAAALLQRLQAFPATATQVQAALATVAQKLEAAFANHPPFRLREPALFDRENVRRQVQSPFPQYQPGPVPLPLTWFEVQALYASGQPVSKAKLVYVNQAAQGAGSEIEADEEGVAFVMVAPGAQYEVRLVADPNPYRLLEARRLQPRDPAPVGVGMVDGAIGAAVFGAGSAALRWGDSAYTSNDAFNQAPALSQVADAIIRNRTPYPPAADDHDEMRALFQALVMGELLPQEVRDKLWLDVALQRLGGCAGEQGAVLRDLLSRLLEDDAATLAQVLEWLNGLGDGDACAYLATLHCDAATHEQSVAGSVAEMFKDLDGELSKLIDASDAAVLPLHKRFCRDVKARLGRVQLVVEESIHAALTPAWARLDALRQQQRPVSKEAAADMARTPLRLPQAPLPARQAVLPPALDWIELEYLHSDDAPVADAEYVVTDLGGTELYQGKLVEGYAHLAVPQGLQFQYRYRRDAAFVPAPAYASQARGVVPLAADFLDKAIAADKLLAPPGFFAWNAAAISDQPAFEAAPTCGAIAHQCVLVHTTRVAWADDELELARLLGPLVQQSGDIDALWTAVVFLALGMLELPEGRLVQELLQYLSANGLAAGTPELVKRVNSAGKGNAVRWLEKLAADLPAHRNAVAAQLNHILQELKAAFAKIGAADAKKLGPGIQAYAQKLVDGVAVLDAAAAVAARLDPLTQGLQLTLAGHAVQALAGDAGQLNRQKQEAQPLVRFAPSAAALAPWLGVHYQHADGTPVNARCIVRDDADTQIADAVLGATGMSFAHGLATGKSFTLRPHKEPAFAISAAMQSQATTLLPLAPDLTTMHQKFFTQYNLASPYAWGETGLADMAEFERGPHLGRIARNEVRRATPFLTKPGDPKDEIEMSEMLRYLLLQGEHANLRVWSIVAMNRIGCAHADGLLRRAVLLRLQFADPFPGTLAYDLVAMLNTAGKGHAVEWLQALLANLDTLRDDAVANIEAIVQAVRDEVVKLNRAPLSTYLKNRAVALGADAMVVKGQVAAQIAAVIAPLKLRLDTLFGGAAAKFGAPVPALLNQMNVVVQPAQAAQECGPDCVVAPAWPHNPDVELQYEYADGTPVIGADYALEDAANAAVFNGVTALQGKSGVKTLPAGTSVLNYRFGNDPLAYAVKAEIKPWPNPYVGLPANYPTTAAATNVLAALPALPAGTLTVRGAADFNLAPSLGAMIADAVIKHSALVSAPGDVQDLGAVIQNMIADPPVISDETWFRAGVNGLGAIADVGSVLRGLFLFFRYKAPVLPVTLLGLMNWAGKGNVAKWLRVQTLDVHIQAAATRLADVLNELKARLEELRVHGSVHADIKTQIAAIQLRIDTASGLADAQVKAQLGLQRTALDALLVTEKLWRRFPAEPVTLNVYRQPVEDFLETNDQIPTACKKQIDKLAAAAVIAANVPFAYALPVPLLPPGAVPVAPHSALFKAPNMDMHGWRALSQYLAGARGMAGKRLAPLLSQASKASFAPTMEAELGVTLAAAALAAPAPTVSGDWTVTMGAWSGGPMWSFQHTDGTLIRYKPDGDAFMKPPCATYSIELIKDTAEGYVPVPNNPLAGTAFKIDGQGNAVPKGPGDKVELTACPCGGGHLAEANKHYTDHLMKSGHRSLRF